MDGKEVLEEIETDDDLATLSVVVLRSLEAERDIIESYRHNANAYLTKPVGYEECRDIGRQIRSFRFEVIKLPRE
jgi:DNA-binding response OmpR family regulator